MEVGKKYYIIEHAYYHVIGEVIAVLGPRTVRLKNCIQIHSCPRSWTEFFRDGAKSDTRFDHLSSEHTTQDAIRYDIWEHPIPRKS